MSSVLIHTARSLKILYLFLPAGPLFEIFFERPISPAAAILCLTGSIQSVTGLIQRGQGNRLNSALTLAASFELNVSSIFH